MTSTESDSLTMATPFIAISGLIGAGKTTLASKLSECMNITAYYEPVIDNEYLVDFYSDMGRYAFPLQIYLLNNRVQQQQAITWGQNGGVSDRTIYEDSIFCKVLYDDGHMTKREYDTYKRLFNTLSNTMRHPDVILHLDVTPEEAYRRIMSRGRDMEMTISIDYLRQLHDGYETWLTEISRTIPVIKLNWNEFRDSGVVATKVTDALNSISSIITIDFD